MLHSIAYIAQLCEQYWNAGLGPPAARVCVTLAAWASDSEYGPTWVGGRCGNSHLAECSAIRSVAFPRLQRTAVATAVLYRSSPRDRVYRDGLQTRMMVTSHGHGPVAKARLTVIRRLLGRSRPKSHAAASRPPGRLGDSIALRAQCSSQGPAAQVGAARPRWSRALIRPRLQRCLFWRCPEDLAMRRLFRLE